VAGTRRLAAIMFTDMVGFTALSQRDESLSLAVLEEQRGLLRPIFRRHSGREVKTIGDAFLVEFPSALEAVRCGFEVQRSAREFNYARPAERQVHLRIGVHLGDVVESGGDISGDAVNVASRIEPLSEDGGVCLSQQVFDQVQNKFELPLASLGSRTLKNVAAPVGVYRIVMPWNDARASPSTSLDRSRVAVLPFVNISPDPNDEFFADGLTEELIANLALVKGLKVIARTSVMNYKKKEKNVSEIGRELGVGTVVEGSVRKAANRIRVTVQVIDVATEEHLWASSYDDNLDDVFAVQRDIATKVAAALPRNLVAARAPIPALQETRDIPAYLLFLQGQALVYQREEEPLRQSLKFFAQAVDRDPSFSRAHASAARAYIRLGEEGYISWADAIRSGREAAEKARAISPDLAEAHAMLAELSFMADEPAAEVEREARRAVELNPNLAEAHDILGQLAGRQGDLDGYVRNIEAAYRLDPLSALTIRYLGRAYFFAGREEEAMDHWRRTLPLDPLNSYRGMTDYYVVKGDLAQAASMVQEMIRVAPTNEYTYLNRGYLAALTGDRATATEMIAKLDDTHGPGWSRASSAGYIYLALGDVDRFFDYMFTAADDHTLQFANVMYSPLFAEARKDPRFAQLLEKVVEPTAPKAR
jgi:adenylate cyclase